MQCRCVSLQKNRKKLKKITDCPGQPVKRGEIRLFRSLDGSLAEILQVLHEVEGGLAGTGAGGLVTLHNLRFGVLGEAANSALIFSTSSFMMIGFI